MKETKFELLTSNGSYFIGASYRNITSEPDADFAKRLTMKFGVATIPLSAFYQDGKDDKVLRFCFAKKSSTLESAVDKLSRIWSLIWKY